VSGDPPKKWGGSAPACHRLEKGRLTTEKFNEKIKHFSVKFEKSGFSN